MRLRSCISVAMLLACSCNSDLIPSLGTSMYHSCSAKKQREKKKKGFRFQVEQEVKGKGGFLKAPDDIRDLLMTMRFLKSI